MATLSEFSKRIVIRAKNIEENVDKLVRKTALAIDREVVMSTPVDTGRARSNWKVSVGGPDNSTSEAYNPLPKGRDSSKLNESGNAAAAMAQGAAAVASRRQGQDVYIQNNLSYIKELNEGSSQQAPAGFVEKAVQVAAAIIRREKVVK